MTPEELQRILDNQEAKGSGGALLYFVALVIVALVILITYGGDG